MIKCGVSEFVITPSLGTSIPGQLYQRKATGIKDDIYVKALVLDDGSRMIAFIAIDAVSVETREVAEIRKRVFESTGIPESNIMVSATHTHTGPPTLDVFGSGRDEEYLLFMVKKASDVALIAFNRRVPAKVGFGAGSEKDIAFNRRYWMKDGTVRTNPGIENPLIQRPEGPIDPTVTVMRVDDLEGHPISVVTNYACHLDVTGGTEYSADYPSELSKTLKNVLGQEVVSLFLTGTCGNINHVDVSGNISLEDDHYKKMGRILAGEVLKVREKIKMTNCLDICAGSAKFPIEVRHPSQECIDKASKFLSEENDDEIEACFAREIMVLQRSTEKSMDVEIQAFRIGNSVVACLPGEIFVEFGLKIRKESPFEQVIISTLSNGTHLGYVPTAAAFIGGYEPRLTHDSKLVPEAGSILVAKMLELMVQVNGKSFR